VRRAPLAAALLCVVAGAAWQWLTVRYNYGGNRTALFCHGAHYPLPAGLAFEHVYVFPNSGGYDGQCYHEVAHDPLYRGDIGRAVPWPAFRYSRILVPGMAYLLAGGHAEWIDWSYFFCQWIFLGLGAWWLAKLLERRGIAPLWAALYVATPVAIVSLDRMLVDLALTSLALGFAFYLEREEDRPWPLYLVLAAAMLCRETGYLLLAAYGARLWVQRRWHRMALFATAAVPGVAWLVWIRIALPHSSEFSPMAFVPFRGFVAALTEVRHLPFPLAIVIVAHTLWAAQIAAVLIAIWHGLRRWQDRGADALANACRLIAVYAICLPPGVYDDPVAGPRILAPLLLFQFLDGTKRGRLPLLLSTPRAWMEMGVKLLGVVGGIL
jgi:hypothetical protein